MKAYRAWEYFFSFLVAFSLTLTSMTGVKPASAASPFAKELPAAVHKVNEKCLNAENVKQQKNPQNDNLHFVGTKHDKPLKHPDSNAAKSSPEAAARGYLKQCGSLFGIQDEAVELRAKSVKDLGNGRSVARFQQNIGNIPVFGGEILLQMNADKNITAIVSDVSSIAPVDLTPSIAAVVATQTALEVVAQNNKVNAADLSASAPELWVYDPALLGITSQLQPTLAWKVEVRAANPPLNELTLVDAHTGSMLLRFNQLDAAWTGAGLFSDVKSRAGANPAYVLGSPLISVYDMQGSLNDSRLPGTFICNQNDPGSCAADADAAAAYQYTLDTYNFYSNIHGRDSIDGNGMEMVSSVNYGVNYQNAFWDGYQMTYGNAYVSDDTVAHELTHGITQYTSNLIYYGQSGAINESFSDIWGEFVDRSNASGLDGPAYDWLDGEDIEVIRSLKDPPSYGDPDMTSSPFYYHGVYYDNAGVHTNSGVNNKAAYLMAAGDSFNGYAITGIGIEKTAKIYYEAQTSLLTNSATYVDLYNALNQACGNLQGLGVVTAADCAEVDQAALAVEMNIPPVPPPLPLTIISPTRLPLGQRLTPTNRIRLPQPPRLMTRLFLAEPCPGRKA